MLARTQNHKNLPTIGKPSPEFQREMPKDALTVLPPPRWQHAPACSTDLRLHRATVNHKVGEGMDFAVAAGDRAMDLVTQLAHGGPISRADQVAPCPKNQP